MNILNGSAEFRCPLPHLSENEANDEIGLKVAFMIDSAISLSNELVIKLKSLPRIIAIDPLYSPARTTGVEHKIFGANFE